MNSRKMLTLLAILSLFSCGTANQKEANEELTDTIALVKSDSTLRTGWYYLDYKNGLKRQADKDTAWYFINPTPIVTAANIIKMEVYENDSGNMGLLMQLDSQGADLWSEATDNATNQRLAFILNDRLLQTSLVNGRILNGMTALNTGNYSRQELEEIKKEIQKELP